jgi:hypothetical protein
VLNALKGIMVEHPGESPVFLHLLYEETNREVILGLSSELKIDPTDEIFDKIKGLLEGTEIRFS